MLSIRIQNFIFIDSLEVNFKSGLQVITGQSGSGKSVFLKALSCLLGDQLKKNYIGKFGKETRIEAIFNFSHSPWLDELKKKKWVSPQGKLVCSRKVSPLDSQLTISDKKVKVTEWKKWASRLVHQHSQFDIHQLFSNQQYLSFLDIFSGLNKELQILEKLYIAYDTSKKKRQQFEKELAHFLLNKEKILNQKKEFSILFNSYEEYQHAVQESQDRENILINKEKASSIINQLENSRSSLLPQYERILSQLEEVLPCLKSSDKLFNEVNQGYLALQEITYELNQVFNHPSFSEERDNQRENTLYQVARLSKKYQLDVPQLIEEKKKIKQLLDNEETHKDKKEDLLNEEQTKFQKCLQQASIISSLRQEKAKEFSSQIVRELSLLGLEDIQFNISFSTCELSEKGTDNIEFMVSFNPGEEMSPLYLSASGGEMSRFLFAMKLILAKYIGSSIMVFDEIDSNVGADSVQKLVLKLKKETSYLQFICVSHSHIMARSSDTHFKIEKENLKKPQPHVKITMNSLTQKERKKELLRLIGELNEI